MHPDIEAAIKNRQIPEKFRGVYRRALAGQRPAAVKAMCLECQGWDDGVVEAVRACVATTCPLHAVRPYQGGPK